MMAFLSSFLKNKRSGVTLTQYLLVAALIVTAVRVGARFMINKLFGAF
jgi:hypothetical protein